MLKFLGLAVGLLITGPAWAGCYHYSGEGAVEPTEKAPRAEVCFKGKCEKTAIQFTCGNAYSSITAFDNGWKVERYIDDGSGRAELPAGVKEEVYVSRDDEEVGDTAALQCRPIDENACEGFPL